MEYNQEARIAHKRTFLDFLDQDNGKGEYMNKIARMRDNGQHRLLVDLTDLRNYDAELTRRLIRQPGEYLQAFGDALGDATRNFDAKYLKKDDELLVGFEGQFGFHKVTPRELMSSFLGTLVCVEGIVTKCSLVRPKVVKSVHYCPTTKEFMSKNYRDVTSVSGLPTDAVYPTKDDQGNLLVTEYGLCKYKDHQSIAIQEMPENSPPGQLPRSIEVIVEDDLVDSCKPGDRVGIVGVYKAIPSAAKGSTSGTFRTVLVGNNVVQLNKEIAAPKFSQQDLKNIRQVAGKSDAWDLLGESLAPSICGHENVKKAILLLLLGGCEKNLANGTHIRGDINMLMVGDPSVAKSQILRAIMNLAPLAISTTGRGSSGVGLTAAVTQDQESGERRLEAGAMVLADRGVVCIDEFDKMSELDRVAIHEVMEQQTVTIAKAGIHASLNARCSVVAAANPIYGNYDHGITPMKNIGLPDSLLSRFDVLFIVLDHMDAEADKRISEHVLRMHRYRRPGDDGSMPAGDEGGRRFDDDDDFDDAAQETEVYVRYDRLLHGDRAASRGGGAGGKKRRDPLTLPFLKKFIHYAKSRTPRLSDEASEHIAQAYGDLRSEGTSRSADKQGTLPITARSLETVIRLSTAHAKLKLQKEVLVGDVKKALELLEFAIYHKEMDEMRRKDDARERADKRAHGGNGGGGGAAAAAAGGGGGASDDDGGGGGDGDDDGSGGKRASKRRRQSTGGTPAQQQEGAAAVRPPASGAVSAAHAGEPAAATAGANQVASAGGPLETEPQMPAHARGSGARGDVAAADDNNDDEEMEEDDAEATGHGGDNDDIHVAPDRVERFKEKFVRHVMGKRLESVAAAEVAEVVNRDNRQPFTAREIDSILRGWRRRCRACNAVGTASGSHSLCSSAWKAFTVAEFCRCSLLLPLFAQ